MREDVGLQPVAERRSSSSPAFQRITASASRSSSEPRGTRRARMSGRRCEDSALGQDEMELPAPVRPGTVARCSTVPRRFRVGGQALTPRPRGAGARMWNVTGWAGVTPPVARRRSPSARGRQYVQPSRPGRIHATSPSTNTPSYCISAYLVTRTRPAPVRPRSLRTGRSNGSAHARLSDPVEATVVAPTVSAAVAVLSSRAAT